ncbi:MAG: histidine kinase [Bacteroidaceae bacterium]|nr:histidine kinase [Bacteroidaceae bacterium]
MLKNFPRIDKLWIEEKLSYTLIWLLVFALPLVGAYYRYTGQTDATFEWDEVTRSWKEYLPFLLLFIVHDWLIAPLIVHENKKLAYLGIATCALLIFGFYIWNERPPMQGPPPHEQMQMTDRGPRDMGNPPPQHDGKMGNPPPKPNDIDEPLEMRDGNPPDMLQGKLSKVFVAILMMGVNLGIMLYFKQRRREDNLIEQQQEKLQQELEYLKYQINPHFFMNTLNNIHALVDIDPEKAKSTIIELSKLMRYVLYESSKPTVLLSKETDFLQQYIALMRLRYSDRVAVEVSMPTDVPGVEVPPLLFISFIENAFKHGVSYEQNSFVSVKMQLLDGYLSFTCENSQLPHDKRGGTKDPYSGIGLENVRKRLKLIYGNDYFFLTNDGEDTYEVTLKIPVKDDTMLGN